MYVYMFIVTVTEIYISTSLYLCKYRNTVADWAMLTLDSHNYCRAPPRHATIWSLWAGHQVEVHSVFIFWSFPYDFPIDKYYKYQYHLIPLCWTTCGSALCNRPVSKYHISWLSMIYMFILGHWYKWTPCICQCICLSYLYYDFHDNIPNLRLCLTQNQHLVKFYTSIKGGLELKKP